MIQQQSLLVAKSIRCLKEQYSSLLKLNGKSERVVGFTSDCTVLRVADLIVSTIVKYNNARACVQMQMRGALEVYQCDADPTASSLQHSLNRKSNHPN